jgi:HlyD family secretion protein
MDESPRMMPPRRLACAALLTLLTLASCSRDKATIRGSGTIEMDEIDVSSLVGGRVIALRVLEGDTVRAGDTLAVLDRGEVAAELTAQIARSQSASAQYRDLQSGARPAEVLAARADLSAAEANRTLADANFERSEQLAASKAIAQADLDRARAERDAARARARSASEQLRLLEEGYRRQQVAAARDAATAAQAQLAGARSKVGELVLTAPIDGVVLLANFQRGEVAAAGLPILTLGNPDSLWMRVFIAAPHMAAVRLGAPVEITSHVMRGTFTGHVVQINTQAEFTPRAALTEEEQANLVFGVKVALDRTGGALKAGLPADAHIRATR